MKLYDPTSSGPQRSLVRAPALASLEGCAIGILENGKLNAPEMLGAVAALLRSKHGCSVRGVYHKANASAPAPAETLARAVQEVDFLITGLGD
jgi:hypothetical protein